MFEMSLPNLAALGTLVTLAGSLFYWAGSIRTSLKKLCEVTADHEDRIRDLETAEQ